MTKDGSEDKGKKSSMRTKFGLGDLFAGIGNLVDLIKEIEVEGKEEVRRTGEFQGTGRFKDLKGIYGFHVKVGLGGKPTVQTFGNIRETEEGPVVEEVREPLVDVFEEKDSFRVLAEMPGVEADDIHVELKDDILTISAQGKPAGGQEGRKYNKEVLLPAKADKASLKTSYKNGVLEAIVRRNV